MCLHELVVAIGNQPPGMLATANIGLIDGDPSLPDLDGLDVSILVRTTSARTKHIIERHGPGPAVHYHIAIVDDDSWSSHSHSASLRDQITQGQEKLLELMTVTAEKHGADFSRLLDIGCGLGGPAIYWAKNRRSEVTGVTIADEHLQTISELTKAAEVHDQVSTLHGDFCAMRFSEEFTAAVAVESSCYMPRQELFQAAASALRPGAFFIIADLMTDSPILQEAINSPYKAAVGSISEYRQAAAAAGFTILEEIDLYSRVTDFPLQSSAWAELKLREGADGAERIQLLEAIRRHMAIYRAFRYEPGMYSVLVCRKEVSTA